jgi:hypothetical protein
MKTRLITLLTMCHTLDGAKDRKGAYTLRHVNKFPKFRPAARAGAAWSPHAGHPALSAQPSLFEAGKAPVVVPPPEDRADGKDETKRTNPTDRTDQPQQPRASKDCFRWFAKAGAFLLAAAAFLPKTAARAWGRLRSPAADSRPRAQGELALEKVTVLRNDLSDSDLVVVAVQPKAEDPRAAQPEAPEPAGNPWTRVTARWIKLKSPAEGGSEASNVIAGRGRAGSPLPAAERRGCPPQSAAQWAQTPP